MSASEATSSGTTKPVLTLVRGSATPEELAAVVAILAARSGGGKPDAPAPRADLWRTPQLRGPLHAGPGAWRASSFRF